MARLNKELSDLEPVVEALQQLSERRHEVWETGRFEGCLLVLPPALHTMLHAVAMDPPPHPSSTHPASNVPSPPA